MRFPISTILVPLLAAVVCADVRAQSAQTGDIVPLDATGVADFSYLNPSNVPAIGRNPISFYNSTSNRTFLITMDFVYPSDEFARAFAFARRQRGGSRLADVVCAPFAGDQRKACLDPNGMGDKFDLIEELRVFRESIDASDGTPPDVTTCDPKSAECAIERVYWGAACELCALTGADQTDASFAKALDDEANAVLMQLIKNEPMDRKHYFCGYAQAVVADKKLPQRSDLPTCVTSPDPNPASGPLDTALDEIGRDAAIKRAGAERRQIAGDALRRAVDAQLEQAFKAVEPIQQQLNDLFRTTEHEPLTPTYKRADRDDKLNDIETAAALLRSYSADSPVPLRLLPKTPSSQATAPSRGIVVGDCKSSDGHVKCSASAVVPPHQMVTFGNATLRHSPQNIIRFKVMFLGETTPPANATAYVALAEQKKGSLNVIPSDFSIGLGLGGATAYDVDNATFGHDRHTAGDGTTSIAFRGGAVEGSVSLKFKEGDFGGPASTRTVALGDYQAKLFGPRRLILQLGQFTFAKPSSGIAISERGEGLQLAYEKASVGYLIHRESDDNTGKINTQNDDYYVTLFQLKNLTLPHASFGAADLILAYGNNKGDERPATPPDALRNVAYTFLSFGGETRLSVPQAEHAAFTLGGYHSVRHERHAREESKPLGNGSGTVGIATLAFHWETSKDLSSAASRPSFGPAFTIARGSGGRVESADQPGSMGHTYYGEHADFGVDQIFLSKIAASDRYGAIVGQGLKNKTYASFQWTDARGSLAAFLASHIGRPETITSRATIVSLHTYRFTDAVNGTHNGGVEGDLAFRVESPKNVTWSLDGAYYHASSALRVAGLPRDPWQISANVSITLEQ